MWNAKNLEFFGEICYIYCTKSTFNPIRFAPVKNSGGIKPKKLDKFIEKLKNAMEISSVVYVKMFQKWWPKINKANPNGLSDLL